MMPIHDEQSLRTAEPAMISAPRASGLAVLLVSFAVMLWAATQAFGQSKLRSDVEKEFGSLQAAYQVSPGNVQNRRLYADVLFKLGDVWQANDVIAPLATPWSSNLDDLQLGAKLALLTSDYHRAEVLFDRLLEIAPKTSDAHTKAVQGLVMVYYQSNQFAKSKRLSLPPAAADEENNSSDLLTFMQRFPGEPYQIEWATPEKIAHLPMINDIMAPGALPLMRLEVNDQTVEFILDTGGDRLYIDEGVATKLGIKNISERKAKYAYTKGQTVTEPLGVADTVKLGQVTLKNVPVIVAKWKALGLTSDGVITTQILKQFLSTVDYSKKEITLRERSASGHAQLLASLEGKAPHQMPFFLASTHLQFAKGCLNGHPGLNFLVDSGLALSLPLVLPDETVKSLGLSKTPIPNTKLFVSPIESHGLDHLIRGATQAASNIFVEKNMYWSNGFLMDGLISHQYLWHLGSWTIDFENMTYSFTPQPDSTDSAAIAKCAARKSTQGPAGSR
jgi:Aspartyl protease